MNTELFQVENLSRLTVNNFKNNQLPSGIVNVSYDIHITSEPLSITTMNEVMELMIKDET
jgi:hypothetical protein